MHQYIPFIIITVVSFLLAAFFIYRGVKAKRVNFIIIAVVCLIISIASIGWMAVLVYKSFSVKVKKEVKAHFQPRTGKEAYIALFGQPIDTCLQVLNLKDQVVPKLDCCIWLEFQICPSELKKILAQKNYTTKKMDTYQEATHANQSTEAPVWWKLNLLGEGMTQCLHETADMPGAYQILFFSKDSTHAFYCDLAD